MSDTPTPLQERVAQLCDPYQGEDGANAVKILAAEVGKVEREAERLHAAGQDAIDYIDGKHRDAGRVLDGWRKASE